MAGLALALLSFCVLAFSPGRAVALELLDVSVRARVGEKRVVGDVAPESFRAYDVAATLRLPWESYSAKGWGVGMRLMASAGILEAVNQTALVVSAMPLIEFGSQDRRFTADLGGGLALLSRHQFAQQDFGGPLQFALTFGASAVLVRRVAVGYRFVHYSDAGAYGSHTIGVDFHMLELGYRF